MRGTTDPKGMQTPTATTTAGGEDRQEAKRRQSVQFVFWFLGLILFIASCFVMHSEPKPFPFEVATTQAVQSFPVPAWVTAALKFPSVLNNPIPSAIALGFWLGGMLLMGLIFWLRGKSPLLWIQSALFLVAAVMSSAGLNALVDILVGRPRPNPHIEPIHVYTPIVPFPTYPSGHTEHDVVYYGFLLYLSLTKPVREWRYHWILLPLQLYAVYDLLSIGYSRILEGDHWLLDVLGGYLEGLVYLFFFIFLYRWVTNVLARWRERRKATAAAKATY